MYQTKQGGRSAEKKREEKSECTPESNAFEKLTVARFVPHKYGFVKTIQHGLRQKIY